jgi:RNA polymerase sigma-70 factor (ECF subfamily)
MNFELEAKLDLQDIALIRKGGKSLEKGITNLFGRYYSKFFHYFRRTGCCDESAEDLVQEVFVKIIRKIDSFRGDCPVGAWLWTVARRTGYDKPCSGREIATDDNELELIIGASEDCDSGELTDCVRKGFDHFATENNERAQVLTLVAFNGWGVVEVAQFIERTPGATREYISQCRKKLQPYIKHCLELLSVA